MKKRALGVDLDGVLADTVSAWLQYVEKTRGIRALKGDISRYHVNELFSPLTNDDVLEDLKHVWENYKMVRMEDPMIPQILDNLSNTFKIFVTTVNRHNTVKTWLGENNIPFDDIAVFNDPREKHTLDYIDTYIDDYPEVIKNVAEAGKRAILYRHPWNEDFIKENRNPNILIAYNWTEIEQILMEGTP